MKSTIFELLRSVSVMAVRKLFDCSKLFILTIYLQTLIREKEMSKNMII